MSNTIKSSGTVTITTPSMTIRPTLTFDYTTTGYNVIANSQNITHSATYTALNTSSLSDMKLGVFYNAVTGSQIIITRDSAGANVLSVLEGEESAFIPFSGSIGTNTLFAKAVATASVLEYFLSEA